MNVRAVFHLISFMIVFVSLAMGLAVLVSLLYGDDKKVVLELLASMGISLTIGAALWAGTRGKMDLSRKDGFGIVTLGWLMVGLVGSLPFLLSHVIENPIDAIFETVSGFTTTGCSVLNEIDSLPKGILFWRSLTQWLGGMGVLLLCVAILPFLGIGGMQIYRAEMPGPSKDRLTPRITNTAKLLYGVYVILTAVQTVLLRIAGMTWFDAINHSFCTLSTGGFSTHNASAGYWNDQPIIPLIITVFMILGGINFSLHYRALIQGKLGAYWNSLEFRFYMTVILVASALICADLIMADAEFGGATIQALFQVVSIITTTGFATADYDAWPLFSKALIFVLMFSGGCAGSTSGGVKLMRSLVLIKESFRQVRLFMQPQAVIKVKLARQSIPESVVASIGAFVMCFVGLFAIFTLLMTLWMPDISSAASAVIACFGNVGPGFASVGPTQNFATVPEAGEILLTFAMILGRLELFTVLVLLMPGFWKR